jgi:hypothetical protein
MIVEIVLRLISEMILFTYMALYITVTVSLRETCFMSATLDYSAQLAFLSLLELERLYLWSNFIYACVPDWL